MQKTRLAVALALAVLLPLGLTAKAQAEATPYASIRMQTFYAASDDGTTDTNDLRFDLQTNSRLGVKFKTSDEVYGLFEVSNEVKLRHAYGVWDFGPGTLLVGHTQRAYTLFNANVARPGKLIDGLGAGFGALSKRTPMVQVTLKSGVYAALIKNAQEDSDDNVDLPELAVGYMGKFGKAEVGVHGAYMAYDNTKGDTEAYLVAANVETGLGKATLLARAYYGQNLLAMGFDEGITALSAAEDFACYGGYAQVKFPLSKAIAGIVGGGYASAETTGDDDQRYMLFAQLPIKVAKGFTIKPEIAYYDEMEDAAGADEGDAFFIGAQWRFDL